MLMNRLPRREIARQLPPLAACLHHIQHRVHHPALFMLARSTAGVTPCTWFVQQRLQPHPLLVGQIARVHAPTLSTQTLSAYSFQGSFASFWTGSHVCWIPQSGSTPPCEEIDESSDLAPGKRPSYSALRRYRRSSEEGAYTEEGLHVRVQAGGGSSGRVRPEHRGSGAVTGRGRADTVELDQGTQGRQTGAPSLMRTLRQGWDEQMPA